MKTVLTFSVNPDIFALCGLMSKIALAGIDVEHHCVEEPLVSWPLVIDGRIEEEEGKLIASFPLEFQSPQDMMQGLIEKVGVVQGQNNFQP